MRYNSGDKVAGRTQVDNATGGGQHMFKAVVVAGFFDQGAFERCHVFRKNVRLI